MKSTQPAARRGASIIMMMAVIAMAGLLMALAITILTLALKTERLSRTQLREEMALARLGQQFRRDVHRAGALEVGWVSDPTDGNSESPGDGGEEGSGQRPNVQEEGSGQRPNVREATGEPVWTLVISADEKVVYSAADGAVTRTVQRGDQVAERESFVLRRGDQWQLQRPDDGPLVRLAVESTGDEGTHRAGPRIHLEAQLGRYRQTPEEVTP